MLHHGVVARMAVAALGVLAGPGWGHEAGGADVTGPAELPARAVIAGVPKVGYGVHLCPFPGSLSSVLEFLGDPADYDYIMGVSGACFRRIWNKDDGGNVDLMYFEPEPYERIFRALGYEFTVIPRGDKPAMVAAIKESIAAGRPVLATVLVGPPEFGVVTGYDAGGETLIGWSYFQDAALTGYCEVPGWFEKLEGGPRVGLIVLGEKKGPIPATRETLLSSLEWAVALARTETRPGIPDHVFGLAAYDGWADGLEIDADYPAGDDQVMGTRSMVQGDQCVMLVERHSAAGFLRAMAAEVPEVSEPLEEAARLYDEAADLVAQLWPWNEGPGPAASRGLVDAETRRQMAELVRAARGREAEAVDLLEQAIGILKQ